MVNRNSMEENSSLLARTYTGCDGPEGGGLTTSSGNVWKNNRRLTMTAFRSLGLGKRSVEQLILFEWTFVDKELR